MFTALDTPEPTATNTPLPTATSEPTATSTPLPTVTPEPIATATSELIGPVGKVVETAGAPTGAGNRVAGHAPRDDRETTPFKVRNLDITPAGTHVTVTWKKVGTGKQHPQRCRTADPQQYRYKVVLWTGAVGDKSDREEVVDHTETGARVVDLTALTAGTQYAALVQSYSTECDLDPTVRSPAQGPPAMSPRTVMNTKRGPEPCQFMVSQKTRELIPSFYVIPCGP